MASSEFLADWNLELPRPAVCCTIVRVIGSAPQEIGAKMWVTESAFQGTVGGGKFELEVLADSRTMLRARQRTALLKEYVLCKQMGQCCGGRVEVFFEPAAAKKSAVIFGGGHVGRALAEALSRTPVSVTLVDPRPEWSGQEGLPQDVRAVRADSIEYARGRAWGEDDAVCILTHSHDLDFLLVSHFLSQSLGYLGLIGSEHKADVFQARFAEARRLAQKGDAQSRDEFMELWEQKVRCPMGIPLKSKNPKVIAISIAAELLRDWGLKPAPKASGREALSP